MRGTSLVFALLSYALVAFATSASAAPSSSGNCRIVPAEPEAASFTTIRADPASDSTAVLQKALDLLKPGEAARFAPGVYRISKALVLRVAGVKIFGGNATLFSTSDQDGGLTIQADGVGVFDLTLDQDSHARQSTPWSGGIAIYNEREGVAEPVRGTVIQHNTIKHAAAAGIFAYHARDFLIADNTVWRSLADGIHITAGSQDGRVIGNKVSQTGDDMIAVVSYAGDAQVSTASDRYKDWGAVQAAVNRNILIGDNEVSDQYWGRGISVVGGEHLTLVDNQISRSPVAAGIYIERESSFKTYGVHDVVVRGNLISRVQTDAPSYQPRPEALTLTGHGAIEIGSLQDPDELSNEKYRAAFSVDRVALINNEIEQARFSGIRVGVGAHDAVSNVLIQGNLLSAIAQSSIVETGDGLKPDNIQCLLNRLDGVVWPRRCEKLRTPRGRAVTVAQGATLRCSATGDLRPTLLTKP